MTDMEPEERALEVCAGLALACFAFDNVFSAAKCTMRCFDAPLNPRLSKRPFSSAVTKNSRTYCSASVRVPTFVAN